MKALSLTAGLLAAAVMTGLQPAAAADLDYQGVPPPDRYSSAYEDPRYRDIYGPEPRVYHHAPEPRYYGQAPHPVPPGYVYKDGYGDRHGGRGPVEDWRYAQGCLPRAEIKQRLVESGWRDFFDLDDSGRAAHVKARRHNGDLFGLKVDRCSGDVLRADLIERAGPGPYAYGGGPRRYERPYY